eukprot:6631381-Pyramimonas_sp.AAC.1
MFTTQKATACSVISSNPFGFGGNWREEAYALRRGSNRSTSSSRDATPSDPTHLKQKRKVRSKSDLGNRQRGQRRKDFKDPMQDLAGAVLALSEVRYMLKVNVRGQPAHVSRLRTRIETSAKHVSRQAGINGKLAEMLEGTVTDPRELTQVRALRPIRNLLWLPGASQTSGVTA